MPFNLNIDLRQLNTFLTVADTGSFSRASEKLFVAQPALSRQIRMLEEALNVEVFVRHGRGGVDRCWRAALRAGPRPVAEPGKNSG